MPMLQPMTELEQTHQEVWNAFLDLMKQRCSKTEYENWFSSIRVKEGDHPGLVLEVPNIFVREYLNANYKNELSSIVPKNADGSPQIEFVIAEAPNGGREKEAQKIAQKISIEPVDHGIGEDKRPQLNQFYHFETFVEGPSNQFVKSAALGVAMRPGKSYNPLFIHGGVGLGKTHLLHAIGHHILASNKKLRIQCITTEQFINDLVLNLRNKSVDKMKQFYRSLDVLLVDDIQFLQSRLNFEDEFCNTFESLINQNKQIVITSDKPPTQLKLSERLIARMEWGLVANVGIPELETRVAIIQNKAEGRGLKISSRVAFYIAERIFHNVRQLEGALNRLSAYCRIMKQEVTEEIVEQTLSELLHHAPQKRVSVEGILKTVASIFEVRVSDLRGTDRSKEIAFPRQVAMYLAKELINESLMKIAASFGGKTHSTLLHSWKKISEQLESDEVLRRQIQMARRNLEA